MCFTFGVFFYKFNKKGAEEPCLKGTKVWIPPRGK